MPLDCNDPGIRESPIKRLSQRINKETPQSGTEERTSRLIVDCIRDRSTEGRKERCGSRKTSDEMKHVGLRWRSWTVIVALVDIVV